VRSLGPKQNFELPWRTLRLQLRPTGFGHLGLFPEQSPNWAWLADEACPALGSEAQALNLFAYTGASSLAAALGGVRVTHLDAVRGVVQWASDNARASGLGQASLRWIVDDVLKFTRREVRRGRRYAGIVLDPPSFGRGRQGQVWKLEEDLHALLAVCWELLADGPAFVLLTAHTPGVTPAALANLLLANGSAGQVQAGEMLLGAAAGGHVLPSGAYARWTRQIPAPRGGRAGPERPEAADRSR